MSIWHIILTCLGWIFCPQEPHPFGNEWHTACCEFSGILFVVQLVEGKEYPLQTGPPEFEDLFGKTVGLLSRMMKSYFSTGRYVIIYYGFYVLKGLTQLRKKDVFACDFIKKRI